MSSDNHFISSSEPHHEKHIDNNMATARTMSCPYKFSSAKIQNPDAFIREFKEYSLAMNWNDFQKRIGFKLSLEGEALVWSRSLDHNLSFEMLEKTFLERFIPSNNTVVCITELAEASQESGESLLSFLDRMRGIAAKGKLPTDVLLAMALKALPRNLANKLVICPEGINWDTLYKLCGVWDATGMGIQEEANCFYGGYNGVTSKSAQSYNAARGCQRTTSEKGKGSFERELMGRDRSG